MSEIEARDLPSALHPPKIEVYPSADEASKALARRISDLIKARADEGKNLVLGLATGSTPIPLYRELIRLHNEEGLSFQNVISFNLDEYYGIEPDDPQSYHFFMKEQLWDHIDLPASQAHIPSGTIKGFEIPDHCERYEKAIAKAGGLDLQILGIGRSGHIGFNEPPSNPQSTTRLVALDPITRSDAAPSFSGIDNVPTKALTMGIGTILNAHEIVMMAWGESKSEIVTRAFTNEPNPSLPASYLQTHPGVTVLLDTGAAQKLPPELPCINF